MPTYTQVIATIKANRDLISQVESNINRVHDLGGGYQLSVSFKGRNMQLRTNVTGPSSNINKIPDPVLIKLGMAINKIRRWKNDQEADFPTL